MSGLPFGVLERSRCYFCTWSPVVTCDAARNFILTSWPSTSTEAPSPDRIQPGGQWTSPSEFAGKAVFQFYRNELRSAIVMAGARVGQYIPDFKTRVLDCIYEKIFDFPKIHFPVKSTDGDLFTIEIAPVDYLIRIPEYPNICFLNVRPAGI
jgi:hypothetical protein